MGSRFVASTRGPWGNPSAKNRTSSASGSCQLLVNRQERVRLARFTSLTFLVSLLTLALFGPTAVAHAQMCQPAMPPRVDLVQGYTFIAVVTAAETTGESQSYDFEVERVIRNGTAEPGHEAYPQLQTGGELHEQTAADCSVTNLQIGRRYLISSFRLETLESYYTAAWLIDGQRVELVRMYGDRSFDQRLAEVRTLDEAIGLLLTGALPNTSADPPLAAIAPGGPLAAGQVLTTVLLTALVLVHFRRRFTGSNE